MHILKIALLLIECSWQHDKIFLTNVNVLAYLIFVIEGIVSDLLNACIQTSYIVLSVCISLLIQHKENMGRRHFMDFEVLEGPTADTEEIGCLVVDFSLECDNERV